MRNITSLPLRKIFNRLGQEFELWISRVFPSMIPEDRRKNLDIENLCDTDRSLLDRLIKVWTAEHLVCAP